MPANAASGYVVPIGSFLGSSIVGGELNGPHGYPQASQGMFNIYDQNGNVDPRGAFAAPTDAWNALRLGYGTLGAPDALNAGAQEAMNRYLGDPNNGGAGGWQQRWDQWNATDAGGLLSPMHLNALRMNQGFGGRDAQGNPINPIMSNTNQGFTYMQNLLAQNPDLQTGNILGGYGKAMQGSGFSAPSVADYMSAIQPANGVGAVANMANNGAQAILGLGNDANFDQYGMRGVDMTNAIDTANINRLSKNIDTEAQKTLANQLPQVQQAMEAAGLGRSGAGQMALLQNQAQILAQANRDKQNVMAQYTNENANRAAQAINLATQQGYGGAGQVYGGNVGAVNLATQLGAGAQNQWSGLQGNAAMQGLQGLQAFNQIGQQGMSNLYGQTMQNVNQRYGQDTSNYLQSLLGSGQLTNQALGLEAGAQSQAQQDWLGLQANRDQTQQNSLNQALTLANAQRQIAQDRLNQQMQAAMQPYSNMLTIATGTNQNNAPIAPPNFWQSSLASGIGSGIGQGVANYFTQPNQGPAGFYGTGTSIWG